MVPLIDDLESHWLITIPLRAQAELVPGQPWIGRHEIATMNVVAPGATWIVCADLVGQRLDVDESIVAPIAPRSIIRYRGNVIGVGP